MNKEIQFRSLGRCPYRASWLKMKHFTDHRTISTGDEIWILEHDPVFTLGTRCRHDPKPSVQGIPVVQSDRGGQITYHGPGQLIVYLLLDLQRRHIGPKSLVSKIERSVLETLEIHGIHGHTTKGAPGVYVSSEKIAALGLRIRQGCCYHGFSLNIDMDLEPFSWIVPCGDEHLKVTQMRQWLASINIEGVSSTIVQVLRKHFS